MLLPSELTIPGFTALCISKNGWKHVVKFSSGAR